MVSTKHRAWVSAGLIAGVVGVGAVVAGGVGLQPKAEQPATPAGAWSVDPVHSVVIYKIKHNGAANHYGAFFGPTGTANIDPAKPDACALDVTIALKNLSSGNAGRDKHLRNPDFFKSEEYPNITFKATSFKSAGENAMDLTGNLTMLGVTKPVTAHLAVTGKGKGQNGDVMGVEATFTIKRTDWGMDKYVKEGALGDEVGLIVALELGKK